ncbi:hypothetical protein Fmac_019362 [Flemingia macrophylla]|uniref:Uncharacterized protein n=1 Tax=Flemingia macrophylla TaxID=520843 RepID=A0ABD1M7L6_9FABA
MVDDRTVFSTSTTFWSMLFRRRRLPISLTRLWWSRPTPVPSKGKSKKRKEMPSSQVAAKKQNSKVPLFILIPAMLVPNLELFVPHTLMLRSFTSSSMDTAEFMNELVLSGVGKEFLREIGMKDKTDMFGELFLRLFDMIQDMVVLDAAERLREAKHKLESA